MTAKTTRTGNANFDFAGADGVLPDGAREGALGLDPAAKWRVHSFWSDAYLGVRGAGVKATVAATNGTVRLTLSTPVAREIAWRVRFGGK